jgi:hypothetical protein
MNLRLINGCSRQLKINAFNISSVQAANAYTGIAVNLRRTTPTALSNPPAYSAYSTNATHPQDQGRAVKKEEAPSNELYYHLTKAPVNLQTWSKSVFAISFLPEPPADAANSKTVLGVIPALEQTEDAGEPGLNDFKENRKLSSLFICGLHCLHRVLYLYIYHFYIYTDCDRLLLGNDASTIH